MPISAPSNSALQSTQIFQDPRMNANEDGSSWVGTALKATGTVLWILASIASFAFLGPIPGLVVTFVGGLAMLLAWTGCSCSSNFWNSVGSSNDVPPMGRRNYVAIASGTPPPMFQTGGRYVPPAAPHVAPGGGHFVPVAPQPVFTPPPQPVFTPRPAVVFTPPPQPVFPPPPAVPHVAAGGGHFVPAAPPQVFAPPPAAPHVAAGSRSGAGHGLPPPAPPPVVPPPAAPQVQPGGAPHVAVGGRRGGQRP
jgi:hypothetical protein